jgi:hypothetical protein
MAATFDGDNLLITLEAPTLGVLNQTAEQVYDDAKVWYLGGENSRYPFPFATSGGEDITAVTIAGQYYFLLNDLGWRIRSTDEDQNVYWDGNLIPNDLTLPIIVERTGRTVLHLGLQPLVTGITGLDTAIPQIDEIHGGVQRKIWVDTTLGADGTGYQGDPHNNFTSAIDNAEANGITNIVLLSDATADRQLKNFIFEGIGSPVLTMNSQDLKGSIFIDRELEGTTVSTGPIHAVDCILRNNVTGIYGRFDRCGLGGDIVLKTASDTDIVDPYSSIAGLTRPSISANGGACDVSIRGMKGGLTVKGMTDASGVMSVGMAQGRLEVDATNTDGTISCRGVAAFADNSAGSTVDTTGLLRPSEVDEVWKLLGLDPNDKITITPAGVTTEQTSFVITFTGDGITSTTMDRTA